MIAVEVTRGWHSECGLHESRVAGPCVICAAHATAARLEPAEHPSELGRLGRYERAREVKLYEHNGLRLTLREWAARPEVAALDITEQRIRSRLSVGWPFHAAITVAHPAPRAFGRRWST